MGGKLRQFEFRDGALLLSGPGLGELRLKWRPVPTAERRLGTGKWLPYQPEFRVLAPMTPQPEQSDADDGRLQAKHEAFTAFRATIPEDIVKAVEPFTCHQWPLITLLNGSDAARDLVKVNPVLAYALANNDHLQSGGGPEVAAMRATRYSRRKQREILAWMGFPDSDAMVRIMKKISPTVVYPGLMRKLRLCVKDPEIVKIFGHLSALNAGVIFLTCHPEMAALVTPKLLQEVAGSPDEETAAPTAEMLNEIVSSQETIRRRDRPHPFNSRRKVEEWHRRIPHLQEEFNKWCDSVAECRRLTEAHKEQDLIEQREAYKVRRMAEIKRLRKLVFPPPPIPGTSTIVPLRSFAELEKESFEQGNCVGRNGFYADKIMQREVYIYKVLAPARRTLSIARMGNSCWRIKELSSPKNEEGAVSTAPTVQRWLDANQISL